MSKGFLDTQDTIECGLTLKRVRDMIRRYSQVHCTDKYSQHSLIILSVWLNVFVYELNITAVSSNEFLDIQATIESGFIPKRVHDMIRTYSQMHVGNKYSQCSDKNLLECVI